MSTKRFIASLHDILSSFQMSQDVSGLSACSARHLKVNLTQIFYIVITRSSVHPSKLYICSLFMADMEEVYARYP